MYVCHVSYVFPFWKKFAGYFAACILSRGKIYLHSLYSVLLDDDGILYFLKSKQGTCIIDTSLIHHCCVTAKSNLFCDSFWWSLFPALFL